MVNTTNVIRKEFPIFDEFDSNKMIYLDSAATTQRPYIVLEAMRNFEEKYNAPIARGVSTLSTIATDIVENSRRIVKDFFNAGDKYNVIWTSGCTDSLNKVSRMFIGADSPKSADYDQRYILQKDDEILVSVAEHHANLLPWQELSKQTGAKLSWFEVDEEGRIKTEDAAKLITDKTRIIAITHCSNVTGLLTDLAPISATIAKLPEAKRPITVLDAAQSAPHITLDLQELGFDFVTVASHKMYGPTGIGVLLGRSDLIDTAYPTTFGGGIVQKVTMENAIYVDNFVKFEPGSPNSSAIIGFAAALNWLQEMRDSGITNVRFPNQAANNLGIYSFNIDGVHPHDVGQVLDGEGIVVRVGHHCAQPIHRALQHKFPFISSTRASIGIYNSDDEIEQLYEGIERVKSFFLR